MSIRHPVFVVEGDGDASAVPLLFRRTTSLLGIHEMVAASNPMRVGDPLLLSRPDGLEKYTRYATSRIDADSVLIALDFDVFGHACAANIARSWTQRIIAMGGLQRPIAICFFVKEFEALMLACMSDIAQAYPNRDWIADRAVDMPNAEGIRAAKETICRMMNSGSYKPSIDQVKFTSALNLAKLDQVRCFRRFRSAIEWLYAWTPAHILCSPT